MKCRYQKVICGSSLKKNKRTYHYLQYKKAILKNDIIRNLEKKMDEIDFQITHSTNQEDLKMLQNRRNEHKQILILISNCCTDKI